MSTQFEFTALPDGTIPIVLPEEFRGKKLKITLVDEDVSSEEEKRLRLLSANREFYRHKPLEEIVKEQGIKPIRSIEDLRPKEPIWESDEEFFEFLEAMGMDVDNYKSIDYLWKEPE